MVCSLKIVCLFLSTLCLSSWLKTNTSFVLTLCGFVLLSWQTQHQAQTSSATWCHSTAMMCPTPAGQTPRSVASLTSRGYQVAGSTVPGRCPLKLWLRPTWQRGEHSSGSVPSPWGYCGVENCFVGAIPEIVLGNGGGMSAKHLLRAQWPRTTQHSTTENVGVCLRARELALEALPWLNCQLQVWWDNVTYRPFQSVYSRG